MSELAPPVEKTSSIVNNRYLISRRIGGGSFGEIYLGVGPNNEKVTTLSFPLLFPRSHPIFATLPSFLILIYIFIDLERIPFFFVYLNICIQLLFRFLFFHSSFFLFSTLYIFIYIL